MRYHSSSKPTVASLRYQSSRLREYRGPRASVESIFRAFHENYWRSNDIEAAVYDKFAVLNAFFHRVLHHDHEAAAYDKSAVLNALFHRVLHHGDLLEQSVYVEVIYAAHTIEYFGSHSMAQQLVVQDSVEQLLNQTHDSEVYQRAEYPGTQTGSSPDQRHVAKLPPNDNACKMLQMTSYRAKRIRVSFPEHVYENYLGTFSGYLGSGYPVKRFAI